MANIFRKFKDWLYSLLFKKELEIALVGLNNAGKTSLVNCITRGEFEQETIPTIGFNVHRIKKGRVSIRAWDVGGQQRFRSLWHRYCKECQVIIYVVDVADKQNFDLAKEELHNLCTRPGITEIPLLVVCNKTDLLEEKDRREENVVEVVTEALSLKELANFESVNGKPREVCVFGASCREQWNIDAIVKWLTEH